jgi:hypothetical protein
MLKKNLFIPIPYTSLFYSSSFVWKLFLCLHLKQGLMHHSEKRKFNQCQLKAPTSVYLPSSSVLCWVISLPSLGLKGNNITFTNLMLQLLGNLFLMKILFKVLKGLF